MSNYMVPHEPDGVAPVPHDVFQLPLTPIAEHHRFALFVIPDMDPGLHGLGQIRIVEMSEALEKHLCEIEARIKQPTPRKKKEGGGNGDHKPTEPKE